MINKPEPIMLSFLPIILSRISYNFYPLFPMLSPIIPALFFTFFNFLVTMRSPVYLVTDKWVYPV